MSLSANGTTLASNVSTAAGSYYTNTATVRPVPVPASVMFMV
jgi:hypothetical protein